MIICYSCNTSNRDVAKYCLRCGSFIKEATVSQIREQILNANVSTSFIGLKTIQKEMDSLFGSLRLNQERKQRGLPVAPVNLNFVFTGPTGTGKTMLAQYLSQALKDVQALSRGTFQEVQATTLAQSSDFNKEFHAWTAKAQGGVLLVDEIHKETQIISLLSKQIENLKSDISVVLTGLKEPMDVYFKEHPDDLQRLGQVWTFPDYTSEELCKMTLHSLHNMKMKTSQAFEQDLVSYIEQLNSDLNVMYKNGWLVQKYIVKVVLEEQGKRLASIGKYTDEELSTLERDDLPMVKSKTLDEVMSSLDDLVGFDEIKTEIRKLADTLKIQKEIATSSGKKANPLGAHMVITGNPGTGKTTLARKLGEVFRAIGVLSSGHVIEVDRSSLVAPYVGQTGPKVIEQCNKAHGGILFIDEAYTLKPGDGQSDSFGQEAIDTLLKKMEDDRGKFILVVAGYKEPMDRFLGANEGLKSRFSYKFNLPDYDGKDLLKIFKFQMKKTEYTMSPEAEAGITKLLDQAYKKRDKSFANGRTVRNLFEEMEKRKGSRLALLAPEQRTISTLSLFTEADLPQEIKKDLTPKGVFANLDALVGLDAVKKEMTALYDFLQIQKKREEETGKASSLNLHFIFSGNPGTGKTTVARLLGQLFKAIGLLPDDKVIERSGKDLVGQYVGSTVKKVNEIVDQSLGGVLFIDEAYTLTPEAGMDSFSKEAVDTLLKRLEDDRGRFICIAAGYKKEMNHFLQANPGLPSRFTRTLNFEDYTPEQLQKIFENFASNQEYTLMQAVKEALPAFFQDIFDNRTETFGNARDVRNIWDKTIQNQAARLAKSEARIGLSEILPEDLPGGIKKATQEADPLTLLNNLIGMEGVKKEVAELIMLLKVEAQRAASGGKYSIPNLHMVLTGNPGTGKTTIAKILGSVFKQLGILKRGQLVETDRSGLVGEYVGQTAQKTQKKINEAMGGLLFIDEAYTLAPDGGGMDFGKEAIDTLLKRMEDDRGSFIVLAAGYKNDMERFLASNDGLRSRFTRYIHFDDYTPDEMTRMFLMFLQNKGMTPGENLEQSVLARFTQVYESRDQSFANGRTVRNFFERCLQKQAQRLSHFENVTNEQLNTLIPEDLA